MLKSIFIVITLLLSISNADAQRKIVDSLLRLLPIAKHDTDKFLILSGLVDPYKNVNVDSGVYYAQQALLLSKKIDEIDLEGWALDNYGYALFNAGNYPDALEAHLKALKQFQKNDDTAGIAEANLHIGFVYRNMDEYRKAIDYFSKYKLIADYYNDDLMRGTFFIEAGKAYEQLNFLDTALLYHKQGYALALNIFAPFGLGGILCNLGTIYSKMGSNDSALGNFRLSLSQSLQRNDFKTLARCYNEMAKHFYKNKQSDSAIFYSKKAMLINQQHLFTVQTLASGTLLTDIYKDENKYDSAFKYQQIMLTAKDSLMGKDKTNRIQTLTFNEQLKEQEIIREREQLQNKIKIYALLSASFVLLLIAFILYRNNKQKQRAKIKIEEAYNELKSTQAQLIQREKMASLGELTAGIAHEIQNPLNFVNNFSEVNNELISELVDEVEKGNTEEVKAIATDIKQNLEKINHHGRRADAIVKGMLQHSRTSTGQKEPTDINALADEYLRLAYHGLRAKDKFFNATLQTDFDESIGKINIVPQEIGRVLLNLFNNAFYAVNEKKKLQPADYEPTVSVSTKKLNDKIEISVKDNGKGIPQKILDKIFQPFFTTKPTGEGTGLGLSLSYDIIKAHGGELKVETKEGKGSEFIIQLPAA
jgi:two-component system, NtrC family, sensor kinase